MIRFAYVLGALVAFAPAFAQADGKAIAVRCDKANTGFGGESSAVRMTLINAQGDKVERKIKLKTAEIEDEGDRSMLTFEWPPDVKGTRLLTHTHADDDDDQWLYLPAMKRVKRISSRNQSSAFMGSEFAFEDLGGQEPSKYEWTLDSEAELGGRAVWILTRVPTNRRSGYSKQVVWMDKQYHQPIKIDYYDRKKALLKTMVASGFTQYEGKWWRPSTLEMVNHQTHKKSILEWTARTMGVEFDEEDFERDALED